MGVEEYRSVETGFLYSGDFRSASAIASAAWAEAELTSLSLIHPSLTSSFEGSGHRRRKEHRSIDRGSPTIEFRAHRADRRDAARELLPLRAEELARNRDTRVVLLRSHATRGGDFLPLWMYR